MKVIYIIIVIILLFSCHHSKNIRRVENEISGCSKLTKVLKENWQYNMEKNIYEWQDSFIYKFSGNKFDHCLKGLSKKDLVNLFGKPNSKIGRNWHYYGIEKCHTVDDLYGNCQMLVLHFTKEGKYSYKSLVVQY